VRVGREGLRIIGDVVHVEQSGPYVRCLDS
jgi:hypothetical protein